MSHLSANACMLALMLIINAAFRVLICACMACKGLGAHVKILHPTPNQGVKKPRLILIGAPCSP